MRITAQHLDDAERLPEGCDLALEELPEVWADICADWWDQTASDTWDDRLLPPAAAGIYGLPLPEQMPRPGMVAGWTHREWIGWATAHGFVEVPRSKHAYQYRHALAPWLLLSMSSSPGDHRWSMATATDLRFAVDAGVKRLAANLYIAVQVVAANVERHPSTPARERLRLLRQALLDAGTDRAAALRFVAEHGDLTWERFDLVEPDAQVVVAIRTAFAALQQEFDASPRAVLRRLGYEQEESALVAKRLAVSASSDLLPGDLLDQAEELLDRLREERDAAELAKQAQRDARPADAPAAPESAPTVDHQAAERAELRRRIELLRVTAAQAVQQIEQAASEALKAIDRATLAPADLQAEVERLRAEVAQLQAAKPGRAGPRRG